MQGVALMAVGPMARDKFAFPVGGNNTINWETPWSTCSDFNDAQQVFAFDIV